MQNYNFLWNLAEKHSILHLQAKFYMHRANFTSISARKTPLFQTLFSLLLHLLRNSFLIKIDFSFVCCAIEEWDVLLLVA